MAILPSFQGSFHRSLMYLVNHVKLALGLEGYPDPTQEEIEAAVAATGYTGYVSMEYDLQKTPDGGDGGAYSVKPGSTPVPDMINSFSKKQLKELVAQSGWASSFDPEIFKQSLENVRTAVLEAFRLAEAK